MIAAIIVGSRSGQLNGHDEGFRGFEFLARLDIVQTPQVMRNDNLEFGRYGDAFPTNLLKHYADVAQFFYCTTE